jgi:hypothetical protein
MEDDAFLHWLAGLIDGEGCFQIKARNRPYGVTYACHFSLRLRDDDEEIVREIAARTGLGRVHWRSRNGLGGNDTVVWEVERRADVRALVMILDEHPLRSRKRRDFEVWREGVAEWATLRRGADWSRMAELRKRLVATRAYSLDRAA